jgi:hypothetical protein
MSGSLAKGSKGKAIPPSNRIKMVQTVVSTGFLMKTLEILSKINLGNYGKNRTYGLGDGKKGKSFLPSWAKFAKRAKIEYILRGFPLNARDSGGFLTGLNPWSLVTQDRGLNKV